MLTKLRNLMKKSPQPLQAYIVPQSDPHNSEYLSDDNKRLQFISNFSGSSGTAVVTNSAALLWTDGRYYTQANQELNSDWTLMKAYFMNTPTEGEWLSQNLPEGSLVGADPTCISSSLWQTLQHELHNNGLKLVPVLSNLIDEIWSERPARKLSDIKPLPISYSGKPSEAKVASVREYMKKKSADLYVVSDLYDIAWLLNLRGSDIDYNPVFFSFVALKPDSIHLFVGEERITGEIKDHFNNEGINVEVNAYECVYDFISNAMEDASVKKVLLPNTINYRIHSLIPEQKRLFELSIITAMKAVKNEVEVENMIKAHIQDGLALCRYFAWLEVMVPQGRITEISGATQLQKFREETEDYIGLSFPTISSSGSNAAIIHYLPTSKTDKPITVDEVYLCDSGAQFLSGTTDVTRTFHFGNPSQMERECFTKVFKGQVALGTAIFPNKLQGNRLDSLARTSLWKIGLDYGHGTGHGIGSYLGVHEGPIGISYKPNPDDPGLQENMFVSNEPGFYLEGKFGIRLENIERIVKANTPHNFMGQTFLTMDTVTLCPIQRKLLLISELTRDEINYLNKYHEKCFTILGPLMKEQGWDAAYNWLKRETAPL